MAITYRNKKTGKIVTVLCEIGGDWELVTQSTPKVAEKPTKPEAKEEKPKAKTTTKKK